MTLAPGKRLGPYQIAGQLGAGGMGEVYRATDTRLGRAVAIKVLLDHLASDPQRRERFEREARAASSLNHPHICTLYDVGDQDGAYYLVMELLEGETLEKRLQKGRLPLDQALEYAAQIADALDKAHRKGIVHRDLKPGNIILGKSGVKLLDFGLAKLKGDARPVVTMSQLPTVDAGKPLTVEGTILGTLQYMAPEQLEGHEADARTDVFAFGAVLYEMLTGRKAFEGKSQASLMGAILEREAPSLSILQPTSPPELDQIIKTCLAKDPDNRWQSAGDIGRQLQWIVDSSSRSRATAPLAAPLKRRSAGTVIAAAILAAAVSGLGVWMLTRPAPQAPPTVSRLLLAPSASAPLSRNGGLESAISPDGTQVVYLGKKPHGGRALFLQKIGDLDSHMIPGTEMPDDGSIPNPFFSWDGASIGFESAGKGIIRVPLSGGPPIPIIDTVTSFVGAAWGPDDNVILALIPNGSPNGLYRISARGGGSLERLTPIGESGTIYTQPTMLPGGKAVLFYLINQQEQSERVAVFDLEKRELHILIEGGASPQYVESGHLVFARGTTLMAVPFSLKQLAVPSGATPVALVQDVQHPGVFAAADYSISRNGTLIYEPDLAWTATSVSPVWVDRRGNKVGTAVSSEIVNPRDPQLSPDGRRLVLVAGHPGAGELWVYDLNGRPPVLLIDQARAPIWYPDSLRIAFSSHRSGVSEVYSIPADGSALSSQLIPTGVTADNAPVVAALPRPPLTWLPGDRLVFAENRTSGGGSDIFAVPAKSGEKPQNLVKTEFNEDSAQVSPNGKWLAYRSNRGTNQNEIWVQALDGGALEGAPQRVSENGGSEPIWARNSKELFYLEGNKMMAVAVTTDPKSPFGRATMLFEQQYDHPPDGYQSNWVFRSYDVASDGRFLMLPPPALSNAASGTSGIVVVQNWIEELKRLMPVP